MFIEDRNELFGRYCNDLVIALYGVDGAITKGKTVDHSLVRRSLHRYKILSQKIKWNKINTKDAVDAIRRIMEIDPGSDEFMRFCCREEIFGDMLMFFGENNMHVREGFICDEDWHRFENRMEICGKDILICIACQLAELISASERSKLTVFIKNNLPELSSRSIYYSVKNSLIFYDRDIEEALMKQIAGLDGTAALQACFDNPVYVISKLYKYRYIYSISAYDSILGDNILYQFITHPESFDYDKFLPEWWPLLSFMDMHLTIQKRGWLQVTEKLNQIKGASRPTVHKIIKCITPDEVEDPDESDIAWLN